MKNKEIMQNRALWERAVAFSPQKPFRLKSKEEPKPGQRPAPGPQVEPIEYREDGSVLLRISAEGSNCVTVETGHLSVYRYHAEMKDRGDGVFEALLPADESFRGNTVLEFKVDGVNVIHPYLPVQFGAGHICNYIEVPDWETPYVLLNNVPHGAITREIFWSETVNEWERCLVYTPPGYCEGGNYPVLYLQHGGGENETCWTLNGKLPYILDNVLAEGKGVPFIVVMNDGLERIPGETGMNDFAGIEGTICEDCRKFIESKYHVRKDKWSRAIAGLSLGSMQASYIGMRHPELFGYIGSFTYLRCRDKDNTHEGSPHLSVLKDPKQFWSEYKLLFRSIGDNESHLNEFQEDDEFITQYGTDQNPNYIRRIYPGMTHNWNCWRRALYDFAQVVFK